MSEITMRMRLANPRDFTILLDKGEPVAFRRHSPGETPVTTAWCSWGHALWHAYPHIRTEELAKRHSAVARAGLTR